MNNNFEQALAAKLPPVSVNPSLPDKLSPGEPCPDREEVPPEMQTWFQDFMDRTPGVAFIKDEAGRFVFVNVAWQKYFGLAAGAVRGKTSADLWSPEVAVRISEVDRRVLGTQAAVEVMETMPDVNGVMREWLAVKFPLQDKAGRQLLGGFGFDVTHHRQMERSLQMSDQRYRRLYASLMDGYIAMDLAGRLLETNEILQQMIGYSAAELKALTHQQITPEKWQAEEARLMAEQVVHRGYSDVFEKEYRHRDGRLIPVELRIYLETDPEGRPASYWALIRDISARVNARRALEQSERRLSLAITATAAAIWEWNLVTDEAFFSSRWYEILGYADQEFRMNAAVFRELCHPEDLPQTDQKVQAAIKANSPVCYECEFRVRTRDGSWRWISGRGSVVQRDADGQPTVLSGTYSDITERKLAALREEALRRERELLEAQLRQAQKMEAMGTLAGGIAHDFNNILGAISIYVELARMDAGDNPPLQKNLAQVLKAGTRAKELVRQILTFSRQNKVERRVMQLQPVIKEALKLLGSTLPATIEINADIRAEAGPVLADATQIHQVLVNLCTNAAQAMGGQPGRLTVGFAGVADGQSATVKLGPGAWVCLTVGDTGCGMAPEVMKHIFEPFFTTKEPGEGTGLGLAVVQGIVSYHRGVIEVSSEPERGTRFDLYFPVAAAVLAEGEVPVLSLVPGAGERVLLVEDEVDLCQATKDFLEKYNYRVLACTNPLVALKLFGSQPDGFELVLTDMTMPGLTGVELARKILQLRPGQRVLLTSGGDGHWAPEKIRAQGVGSFILKPADPGELLQAMRRILAEPVRPAGLNQANVTFE